MLMFRQPPDGEPPVEEQLRHLRIAARWIIGLLIANLIAVLYVADFVYRIEHFIHQLGG